MIYNFKCSKCKYETEKILPVKDRDNTFTCPSCKGVMIRDAISSTNNVIYKGDGFPTSDAKKAKSWINKYSKKYPETKI